MSARPRKEATPDSYAGRFGIRLRELREKKKLTVEELAEKSGIPVATIYNWEKARRMPYVDLLLNLARALKIAVSC